MGILNAEIIEDLFRSSSISKGIERTMEHMIHELEVESFYIIHYDEDVKNLEVVYELEKQKKIRDIDLQAYVEAMKESYHFDKEDFFFAESPSDLLSEEKELYKKCGCKTVIEFRMTDHGRVIGFIHLGWKRIKHLGNDEIEALHVLLKLMNEQLIKQFYKEEKEVTEREQAVEREQTVPEFDIRRDLIGEKFVATLKSLFKDVIAVEIRKDSFFNLFKENVEHKYSYSMDFVLKWLSKVHVDDKQKFLECFDVNFLQNAYLSGEIKKEIDFRYRTHAGEYHCMNGRILFERSSNKDLLVYILFQDVEQIRSTQIEQYRQMREALMAARSAAELKSEVLANISHEIRSPMSGITSMASVAKQVYKQEDKLLECLNNIDHYAENMMQVMDSLLESVKVDDDAITIVRQPFSLEEFLNRIDIAARETIEKKNVQFSLETRCQYKQISGDQVRLYQAIQILINNAISYTPISGFIKLSANQVAVDDRLVYIRFELKDNGNGLNDPMKESIFGFTHNTEAGFIDKEHFELSLAAKLVELMGGQIGINVNEEGTDLYFTLPFELTEEKGETVKRKMALKVDSFKGKKILLAEDSEMTQGAFRAVLEVVGFDVDTVENGKKAVIQFISQPAFTYDAVLMDVHMPLMDGREATRCIRISGKEDSETIPVIGLMANTYDEDINESLQAGMQAHLAKPVDVDKLYRVLKKVMPKEDDI